MSGLLTTKSDPLFQEIFDLAGDVINGIASRDRKLMSQRGVDKLVMSLVDKIYEKMGQVRDDKSEHDAQIAKEAEEYLSKYGTRPDAA